jgi:hypothetical protein
MYSNLTNDGVPLILSVKVNGRSFIARDQEYPSIGLNQSLTTEQVKSFVVRLVEKSVDFMQKFEVKGKDKDELEQTVKTVNDIKNNIIGENQTNKQEH